jgi:hypothetical protein
VPMDSRPLIEGPSVASEPSTDGPPRPGPLRKARPPIGSVYAPWLWPHCGHSEDGDLLIARAEAAGTTRTARRWPKLGG